MAKATNYITTIILVLVFLQMAPQLFKGIKNQLEEVIEPKVKVAQIEIKDAIMDTKDTLKYVKKYFEDKDIKAILLRIESPGGAAGSSYAIFNEIKAYKKDNPKPMVTLTNDLCASGAYFVACASDYIISSPSALVGSIGSYVGFFKFKEFIEQWKIQYNVKQSGSYKTVMNPFTSTSEEKEKMLQELSDDVYEQLKQEVAASRKLPLNESEKWANGRIFTGKQALELGLVDELGSEYNAEQKIRELAMIEKDKKINWVKPPKPSVWDELWGNDKSLIKSLTDSFFNAISSKMASNSTPKIFN